MTGTKQQKNNNRPMIHVYPANDTRRHKLDRTSQCWCKPKVTDFGSSGIRLTHNSEDGREIVERELGELLAANKTWKLKFLG